MADAPKKAQSKIRTFAQDLDAQREMRGVKKPTTEEMETTGVTISPEPMPIAKAPGETTEQRVPNRKAVLPQPKPTATPVLPSIPKPQKKSGEVKPIPTKIPAFHELQDAIASIQEAQEEPIKKPDEKPVPEKIVSKQTASTPRVNIGYDAKVITDTQHKRFKLFPAITESVQKWWKSVTKKKKSAAPKYSVSDASRRQGVIQKATSKSGSAFTGKDDELKQRIKQRKERQEEEQRAQTEAEHKPETFWTPFTEPGYGLLDEQEQAEQRQAVAAAKPKNVVIEYKKQRTLDISLPAVEQGAANLASKELPAEEPVTLVDDLVSERELPPETVILDETMAPEEITLPVESFEEDLPTEVTPVIQTGINRYSTNTLTVFFVILIAAIIVLVLGIQFILGLLSPQLQLEGSDPAVSSIVGAEVQTITLEENTSITNLINQNKIEEGPGLTDSQIYSQNGNVVPAAVVIELLQFNMNASFRQSLTDVRFVHLNQSKPIIVFSYADQETIQGGFLAWENNMLADLRTIFEIEVIESSAFSDQIVSGRDVRVLLSQTGQTLIVYGLVDENTALISNSLEDFSQVLETSFPE